MLPHAVLNELYRCLVLDGCMEALPVCKAFLDAGLGSLSLRAESIDFDESSFFGLKERFSQRVRVNRGQAMMRFLRHPITRSCCRVLDVSDTPRSLLIPADGLLSAMSSMLKLETVVASSVGFPDTKVYFAFLERLSRLLGRGSLDGVIWKDRRGHKHSPKKIRTAFVREGLQDGRVEVCVSEEPTSTRQQNANSAVRNQLAMIQDRVRLLKKLSCSQDADAEADIPSRIRSRSSSSKSARNSSSASNTSMGSSNKRLQDVLHSHNNENVAAAFEKIRSLRRQAAVLLDQAAKIEQEIMRTYVDPESPEPTAASAQQRPEPKRRAASVQFPKQAKTNRSAKLVKQSAHSQPFAESILQLTSSSTTRAKSKRSLTGRPASS
eukprot:TRINITY_DN2849_c5_g1_i1.p1 TRINITY_DN2849_c5_g1~~TRINITY_DN2849_c5_g1_i1.p1  ORF type:complete len:380 (-),score=51.66 TRINITY_DN2849_c5_g1_i1:225-1364(-)